MTVLLTWRNRLLALALVAGLITAAFTPWRIAATTVDRLVTDNLSRQLGFAVTGARNGSFVLLPTPRLMANDVRLSDGNLFDAVVPGVSADIRLLALLAGRVEFAAVTLHAPQVNLRLGRNAASFPDWLISPQVADAQATPRIVVRGNGAVFIRNEVGIISTVRDIGGEAAARAAGDAWEMTGNLTWRGERLTVAYVSNSTAKTTIPMLRARGDVANLEFVGARRPSSATPAGALEGQFSFSTTSFSRLSTWMGHGASIGASLGATEIAGRAVLTPGKADFRSAAVTLGADTLEGAFSWQRRDDRWQLSGTFAGRSLDIARPGAGVNVQQWSSFDPQSTLAIDAAGILTHDLDLRLSIQRLRIGSLTLGEVAAQIMGGDQRLEISLANASLYRGAVRGRVSLDRVDANVDLRAQIAADRVDLGLLSGDVLDARRLTGIGGLQASIEGHGRSMADLIASLQGRVTATARNGDFMGTNLTEAMRRIERQPLAVARDWRGGRTAFEHFGLTGVISGGILDLTEGAANGVAYRLSLGGRVSLPERLMRLSGSVLSANASSVVPFDIVGPLNEPSVSVNPRGLIERSGAVQPFLERRAP